MEDKKNPLIVAITQNGSFNAYIRQVNSIPMLTLDEENELTKHFWKDMDFVAAQKLVLSHLRLVVKIAQTFKSYQLPMQDIISEGNIGLMKAVQKFTPSAGCRLATYASWWIRAAIQEYILNSFSLLKVNTKVMKKKLFYKISQTKDAIRKLTDYEEKSLSNLYCLSLDSQDNANNQSLIEFIPSNEKCHAEAIIEKQEKQLKSSLLKKGLEELNDREKDILYRRRLKDIPDTLREIAREYKVSQERVRQIEQQIMEKLKSFMLQYV